MTRARLALIAIVSGLAIVAIVYRSAMWQWTRIACRIPFAAARYQGAMADWRAEYGDPDALSASYVHAANNAAADRLTVLVKPLGISLDASTQSSRDFAAFGRYANAGVAPPADRSSEPPDDVRRFLDDQHAQIAAVVDLLTSEAPVWKCDYEVDKDLAAPLPGIRMLNNVLGAQALVDHVRGRDADADRTMQAAWQLVRATRGQAQLIGELISMAMTSTDVRLLRVVTADALSWHSRLLEHDVVADTQGAIRMESVRFIRGNAGGSFLQRAFLADYLDAMRPELARLRKVSLTEPRSAAASANQVWASAGTAVAGIAEAGLARAVQSAQCVQLDEELTERVLDARAARKASGRWSAQQQNAPSGVAAGASWVYRASGDAMSIALDRDLPACSAKFQFDARR